MTRERLPLDHIAVWQAPAGWDPNDPAALDKIDAACQEYITQMQRMIQDHAEDLIVGVVFGLSWIGGESKQTGEGLTALDLEMVAGHAGLPPAIASIIKHVLTAKPGPAPI